MAGIYYRDGANTRAAISVTYRDGATNRAISEAWYQDGATLRKIWPAGAVALTGKAINDVKITPATATATLSLLSAGTVSPSSAGEWLVAGAASDFEVFVTVNSGALSTGTAGSWLSLGTTLTWTVSRPGGSVGTNTANITVSIRDVATATVLASAVFTLTANVTV